MGKPTEPKSTVRPTGRTIYEKITDILGEMTAIPKSGRNKEQNYLFIEQAVIAAVMREKLFQHRLVLKTEVTKCDVSQFQTVNNKRMDRVDMLLKFTLINAEKPEETMVWENWPSTAFDTSDKGVNKASTAGQKYFLIRQFLISDAENDPDLTAPEAGDDLPTSRTDAPPAKQDRATFSRNTASAPLTPPAEAKHATEAHSEPKNTDNWREYTIPIGRTIKGKVLGSLDLSELIRIKEEWIDKLDWNADRRTEQEVTTSFMVLRAIEEMGKEPIDKDESHPYLEAFTETLGNYMIKEGDFLTKAIKAGVIPDTTEFVKDLTEGQAQMLLDSFEDKVLPLFT